MGRHRSMWLEPGASHTEHGVPAPGSFTVDQAVPGDVATRVLEILLQAQRCIGQEVLAPAGAHERSPRAAKPTAPAPDDYGSLADILLPRTPQRLDGPPHRPPQRSHGR